MNSFQARLKHQNGAASLIFVLLIGLAITASTTGLIKSIKNTQEIGVAVNAVTHAQTGLWAAAEAFRVYLASIDDLSIQDLSGDLAINMDPAYGSISANDISVTTVATGQYRISTRIVNQHLVSRSSAAIIAVYTLGSEITPSTDPIHTVNFNHNLDINGGIEIKNNGDPVNLTVIGDVDLGGVSINPINEISATGSVTLGSKITVNSIFAEEDVVLNNTIVQTVKTLGTVIANGSATAHSIWANGDVTLNASGRFENINTLKNIIAKSGGAGHGTMTAGETIKIDNSGPINSLSGVGDIEINTFTDVTSATTMADLTCPSPWWSSTSSLSANGAINNCPSNSDSISVVPGASNTIVPMQPLTKRTFTTPSIDVWKVRNDANYFVAYDADSNDITVTVNSVESLVDGSIYKLGDYPNSGSTPPYYDYLCANVSSAGLCLSPAEPTLPLCFGQSLWNRCITYNHGNNTFTINPNVTAPGIMFFDGNVKLMNGHGMTTILASGDISTAGSYKQWAVNFGAYDTTCLATADHAPGSVQARYTHSYSTHYPSNLCDKTNSEYLPIETGNIGLAAGGINPDISDNPYSFYTGGNIDLGSSTDVVGAVLAGNILNTGGSVTIRGLVSAGAHQENSSESNKLGGKTVIDFSDTDDFNATGIPDMGPEGPAGPVQKVATLLWARSL